MHSSTEVEYVSASEATKQNVWLRKILEDMGVEQDKVTILFCDYKSAIAMSKNSIFHNLMKHIHLKHHYIWEAIENDEKLVKHIQTKKKSSCRYLHQTLSSEKFVYLRELLGITKQKH